ncbi:MAG: hypothetical protein AB1416_13425, partial [Actinomycetota bacterium]
MSDWPTPERLDALLAGAEPRTDAERDALRLAGDVVAREPALPPGLDARIDALVAGAATAAPAAPA